MSRREKLVVVLSGEDSDHTVSVSWGGMTESSDFTFPYSANELEEINGKISDFDEDGRLLATSSELRDIGERLYGSLFPT